LEASGTPTAEELQQAGQVSEAAAGAIQETVEEGGSKEQARKRAKAAVESKAQEVGFRLSDEDCKRIVDMLIERMDAMGAFDPPAPAAAPAPPPPPAEQQAGAAAAQETPVAPEKKTFAEMFAGL